MTELELISNIDKCPFCFIDLIIDDYEENGISKQCKKCIYDDEYAHSKFYLIQTDYSYFIDISININNKSYRLIREYEDLILKLYSKSNNSLYIFNNKPIFESKIKNINSFDKDSLEKLINNILKLILFQ